jgi:hypothetical protein
LSERLAKAGQWGKNSGNIVDMIVAAAKIGGISDSKAKTYEVKLQDNSSLEIFLPHEIYASEVGDDTESWCLSPEELGGDRLGKVLRNWAGHPDVNFEGDLGHVGVLGFHCDGVQYTSSMRAGGAKSVLVASLNVVSAALGNRRRRFPLFVLRKTRLCGCDCGGYHTMQLISQVLAWSCRCLLEGRAPSTRHDGSPFDVWDQRVRLPSGSSIPHAALLQVRGDWEGLVFMFRLRSYKSNCFCWLCNCTQQPGPMCYHDFRPDAPHRATIMSHQDYMQSCLEGGEQPSMLFRCPGLSLSHILVDSMHAGDLGTFADALGSLFFLEIRNRDMYPNQAAGLQALNADLNKYYKAHPSLSKITPLALTQIIAPTPGYPFLKAKAAQVRHLAEFGLVLANRQKYGDSEHRAYRFGPSHFLANHTAAHLDLLVATFQGLTRYQRSLAAEPFDPDACQAAMHLYLQSMSGLYSLWRNHCPAAHVGQQPFNVRPKAHMLQHQVQDQIRDYGSPAEFWCYRDEDFVGNIKRMCAKTKDPRTLERRVMQKIKILEGVGSSL